MVRLAMLSCAHIHAKGYLDQIAGRDDCRLAVVWDDVADRGRTYAAQHHAEFCDDINAAVARDDVDGFIICAETTRHLPLLAYAIPAGKPIFCEKPFAAWLGDVRLALELLARHPQTVLLMGYGMPFSAPMQAAGRLLAEGALGRVTHARCRNAHHAAYGRWFDSAELAWFADPDLAGGGALMDMGTHAVHLLRTLLGPARRVFARVANLSGAYPKVDDYGLAMIEFADGVLAQVEASWVQTGGPNGLEIFGSQAALYHEPKLGGYVTAAPGQEPRPLPPAPARPRQVDRLIAAIDGTLSRQELDADLRCAADAVAIMEACYRSAAAGAWTEVESLQA